MAAKKVSQAQKAASGARKKMTKSTSKSNSKAVSRKTETERKEPLIPANILVGVISLGLFVLFLVIAVNPDGVHRIGFSYILIACLIVLFLLVAYLSSIYSLVFIGCCLLLECCTYVYPN